MTKTDTDEEWSEFVNVVVKMLESHQDPNFIKTVAYCLSVDVYNRYRGWKVSPKGFVQIVPKRLDMY